MQQLITNRMKGYDSKAKEHCTPQAHSENQCLEDHGLPTQNLSNLNLATSIPLLKLPTEIHLKIAEELLPLEKAALKFSCSYFNKIITPHRISLYLYSGEFPLKLNVTEVEKWPIFSSRYLYGCTHCGSLRPAYDFDNGESSRVHKIFGYRKCLD